MEKAVPAPLVELVPQADQVRLRQENAVACAAALFLAQGIHAVRMTDIADAAGIGVATLYRHFSTKTRIAVAAGTLMWERFNEQIRELVNTREFLALSGGARLATLLREYAGRYSANQDFLRFLDEFDHLIVSEQVPLEDLATYGQAVDSFYVLFADAYQLGRADGSIAHEVDFPLFYRTIGHAMMCLAEKLARGEVIPSDDFSHGAEELGCLVRMACQTLGITYVSTALGQGE